MCVCVCASSYIQQVRRELCRLSVFKFDEKIRAFFQAFLPNSGSFTEHRPCEFRVKWRKLPCLATTSEATYISPSCRLKVVQVRPVFEHPTVPAFYGLIESFQEHQAGCPTFFCRYHTDSLISAHTPALLNFPPHIFDFTSNRANPVLSCLLIGFALWTRV